MTTHAPAVPVNDRDCYPLHEEDDVPEIPRHERQTRHLRDAISSHRPDCFVTGNVCIYWQPEDTIHYRAPDILVAAASPTDPEPRVYLTWRDPRILFVAEIGSRSTFRADEGPKQEIYGSLIQAQEYLYADPPNGLRRLWRIGLAGYEEVAPEANGRLRSLELGLEFDIEDELLRAYTLDGARLRTYEEAEDLVRTEAFRREEAETRAAEERARREEAEAGTAAERARREEAEAGAAAERARREELERQLAALQAKLQRGGDSAGNQEQ